MNNMSKRIMSLILALLMVLEVFSPVAVSADSLLDDSKEKPNPELFTESATKNTRAKNSAAEGLFNSPGVKETPKKETKNIQETPAKKEGTTILEVPAKQSSPQKEPDNTIIEAGRQREEKAQIKYDKALEKAKIAEENARSNENVNIETKEAVKEGYKSWKIKNRGKAVYKDGKLECTGLLIEVEDYDGRKKTLNYDDILRDKKIIVNKEIKDGIFGSSELILTTPGLKDIKIDVKVENLKNEKSELSLNKDNSNKSEEKENTEENEGIIDKIKNFFSDDETTKGLENDAAEEDAELEISDLDQNTERKGILIPQPLTAEEEAIGLKTLEEYQAEESPRFMFFRAAPETGLENKKFTIRTRFDASVANGPIPTTQSFTIHLDDRLTVKDSSTLKPITDKNGKVIARPTYNASSNSIVYNLTQPITENIQTPLAIDVDYNIKKINELDEDATKHSIKNSITGIGVTKAVNLPETVVDNDGNVLNTIVEPGSNNVLEIVDQGEDYQVNMDAKGTPIIQDGKIIAIDWTVRFVSTKDLKELGLSSNATLVKGSGLKSFENILLNGNKPKKDDLTNNEIEGKFGIVASKNHTLSESTKEVLFTFRTPVDNVQEKYMIDLSVALNKKNKSGAVRLLLDKGFTEEAIKVETPNRVGMNNRTTILGEFSSEKTARWTVTDGVSTGDTNSGLPLATRELRGNQTLSTAKMAVYGLDRNTGKMVVKQSVDAQESQITAIPQQGKNPSGEQLPGRIAVYEFNTNLDESEYGYSLAGVNINKYQNLKINQTWAGITSDKKMPAQGFEVKDDKGNLLKSFSVGEGEAGVADRKINLSGVKYWDITEDKTDPNAPKVIANRINHKVVQNLPADETIGGKTYSYKEKYNYLSSEDGAYHIYNVMTESTQEKEADFTVIKFDSKDPNKKLEGAKFTLQSANETIELVTDSNGRAGFSNVSPGTYTLIENKAPNGYKLDTSAKRITVYNDGKVSVSGDNIAMQGGKIETKLDHHQYYPSYPSYMNALHYGKKDGNGNIEFYIYLKPEANGTDGSTNKNTRLNLNVLGGTINTVEVLDVAPDNRNTVKNNMYNQTAGGYTGTNLINAGGANDIAGTKDVTDGYTGKTGYQLKFPSARFANDWGFLVKVKAKGSESTAVSYDWLTDTDRVKDESRIQESIGLSTSSESGVNLNIGNEPFQKLPVEVTKITPDKLPLENATFRLRDANNQIIADIKSGADGKASFGKLSPGNYTIEEISAPSGYQKSQVIFDVTVGEDGKVIYNARFKDGSGTPKNGVDYILEEIETGQEGGKAKITGIEQSMILQEKQTQPNDGRLGWQEGIWEAYFIESYRYRADFTISNATKGGLFKIQFDPNLDFRRYVYEIPELKDVNGRVLAKPYFNYETNLLTYQFTNNIDSSGVNAHIEIIGIIPDKYYATQTNINPGYNFRIVVDPDNTTETSSPTVEHPNISTTISHDKVLPVNIKTDYYAYDSSGGGGPLTSEYIYDIYTDEKGDTYLKAMSYYNPTGLTSGKRTLRYDWISMNRPVSDLNTYRANGYPAFGFQELEVYKVTDTPANKQRLMPLSYGIRPDQDPRNYDLIYSKRDVDPQTGFQDQIGDYRITYDPSKLKSTELLTKDGHNNHPLEINVPSVGTNEGYVVIQTFKVTDKQRYKNLWTGYYFSQGSRQTGSYQKGNANHAIGSETGQEIPKFYTERVKLFNKTYTSGQFKIIKLNEADRTQKLQGATFSLTDEEGNVIYRSSDAEGIIEFKDLEPGEYTLEESRAPEGFAKSNRRWNVTVYDTGNVLIREIGITGSGSVQEGSTLQIPVTNKPVGEKFQVYKKNGKGEALQGAEFTICEKDEKTVVATGTSNTNGIVDFTFADGKQLEEGKQYILKETKQPQGYKPLNKKWVLEVKDGKTKVYNYVASSESTDQKSFITEDNVNWVDVKNRDTSGWSSYDNRWNGWTGNSKTAQYMGTRIIAINKTGKYAIQRYIINPESRNLGQTTASIHRQVPKDPNMTWYDGNAEYKVFELDKPVTGLVSDLRLANYTTTDITKNVTADKVPGRFNEPDRLQLTLPKTSKPIVIDVKVPYDKETGGVGTGMDWTESGTTYWKSDYYERVSDIVVGDPTKAAAGDIKGSYISEGSLDVNNEREKFRFKLKKVKEGTNEAIKGAVFKLIGPSPSQNSREMTTGADGMITFVGLEAGEYTLEETQPAPGYEKVDTKWTVRITDKGKVYIKDNKPAVETTESTETPASTFSIVDLGSKDTAEALSINPELAMKMQRVKALAYGAEDELNSKSLVFMTEADKNEALVKENLDTVYGSDVIADKYSDIVTDKEVGMATYSLDSLGTNVGGLEINPETRPEAQRGGDGWEQVDNASSTQPTKREDVRFSDYGQLIDTKIIEIDKVNNRYKQVFLFRPTGASGKRNREIKFHRAGDKYNISPSEVTTRVYQVPNGASLANINQSSDIDGISNKTDISSKVKFTSVTEGVNKIKTTNITTSYPYTILIEVETNYNENYPIGLGSNYNYNTAGTTGNKCWLEKSYANEAGVPVVSSIKYYNITLSTPDNNGSLTISPNKTTGLKEGDSFILTPKPKEGYELADLKINGSSYYDANKTSYGFDMPGFDITVEATFKQKTAQTYKISVASVQNGSITVKPNENVQAGTPVTVTTNPSPGYELRSLSYNDLNGQAIQVGTTFTMPAQNIYLMPVFGLKEQPQPKEFKVNVATNIVNGSVTAEPTSQEAGKPVSLTVTPDEGFEIQSVTMNGQPLTDGADGKYSFTMPAGNVTVSATFKKIDDTPDPEDGWKEITAGSAAQITNKQVGIELKVHKINNMNEGLDGAEFTLKKYTDGTFTKLDETFTGLKATSDEKGNVVFKDGGQTVKLNTGYYILEETKSPVGYKKAAAPWKLQVKEENGSLVIVQNGPEQTAASFLTSDKAVAANDLNGKIKYKSIVKNIDPDSNTFVQRVYIDTRAYGKVVNVQITPKHKREEIDRPGLPPVTIKEGVKTAYRSTYQITNPPANVDVDEVLNSYDLREANVRTVNTARWRPFDWGFDEDLLNLEPGVYYIDIEGYYDNSLIDRKVTNEVAIDSNYNFTEKDGRTPSKEPVLKDPYERTNIKGEDLGKLDLHIDFYDGAREFQEINDVSYLRYEHFDQGSYQHGATTIKNWMVQRLIQKGSTKEYAQEFAKNWANKKLPGQKYVNALSKKVKINSDDKNWLDTAIIYPPLTNPALHADTSLDISSLYSSDTPEIVPQEGMSITNEKEVYNITFSKHSQGENDNTNRLEGAVFKLQKKQGSFWYDLDESYVSSAFNGYFGFRRLEPGTYRLLEVSPPDGYRALDGTLLEFVIKTIDPRGETFEKDGKIYDKESGLRIEIQPDGTHKVVDPKTGKIVEGANGYVTITNKKNNYLIPNIGGNEGDQSGNLVDFVTSATAKNIGKVINEEPGKGSVTINKVDENGKAIPGKKNDQGELIAGAKFRATRLGAKTDDKGNPVADAIYEGYVDENGKLTLDGLPLGNYELREVESPNGYINTGHVWHFTVGGKGLDPYAEDTSPRTRDITSLIELTSSDMEIQRPYNEDKTQGDNEIRPHVGQSLQFTNDFKIQDGVKISSGDYFVLKLTDNMDLHGIREDKPTNLDLFADGIGTIAKADYDRQAGTITYTFTKAAEQYTITDFKNVISSHINLYAVKNSSNQKVGMSIGNDTSKLQNIYVNYIVGTEKDDDGNNFINMASKIISFNSETGEFVHYFYVNRLGEYDGRSLTFGYMPNQKVENLRITTYDLNYTNTSWKNYSMPASFGVNENDSNLRNSGGTQPKTAQANQYTTVEIGSFPNNRAAIVKVTGKIDTANLTEYRGNSALYDGGYWSNDGYYDYWNKEIGVYRWDGVYVFENQNTADATFELKITNPSNKVVFEKVNTDGQVLKPTLDDSGKVTDGAQFSLQKNSGTIESPGTSWPAKYNPTYVDKNGQIAFEHLEKGLYRLVENKAPEGYTLPKEPVAYLKVDESGKIYRKVTVPNTEGTGTSEIYQEVSETIPIKVVNNKPIEFIKVDAEDGKILQGAEFKVLYKEKETDLKYKDYLEDGKQVTAKSDDKGKFSLNVSKDGYYALEETKAPDGYSKFPGYIKEFKLENGKIQVLEKDPLKASLTKGANGMLKSEILEVDKDKRTFKDRLVINPGHTQWTFDKEDTLLQLDVNNWNVSDQYRTIKVATLEKGKSIADLTDADFRKANPRNQGYNTNPLIYSIPSLYRTSDYTQPNPKVSNIVTEKALVVEITGTITDKTKAVELNPEVYSRAFSKSIDKVNYKLDINNMSEGKGTYIDYESKDPIKVENRKGEYPHTGGMGTLIFTVSGLILMTAAAYVYSRKRRTSYDE